QERAGVEAAQGPAMAAAEARRLRQALARQSIEARLGRLVERRGRLVEKEPLGLLDQGAREGDALLLARGELKRPVRVLVQAPAELAEADRLERLAQGFVRDAAARHRIAHDVAEPADRQGRPLRGTNGPRVSGGAGLAPPGRPDTRDRARRRALALGPGARAQHP